MALRHKVRSLVLLAVPLVVGTVVLSGANGGSPDVSEVPTTVTTADGRVFTGMNHLVTSLPGIPAAAPGDTTASYADKIVSSGAEKHEYMLVWAGDEDAADLQTRRGTELDNIPGKVGQELGETEPRPQSPLPGPDFLAVVDADPASANYGKVVNTLTMPVPENESHHMQYIWHQGQTIFAGGLLSDFVYAIDASKLPMLSLKGINTPLDTPCGSVPDAFWVMKDGTAYGTWMGGPNLPGPCTYTNGQVRMGNGFAGSPGEVVHLDQNGKTISESPAATTSPEWPGECTDIPSLSPATCANPHGIQLREDLNTMVTADFAEPRDVIEDPLASPSLDENIYRRTVRTWDISDRGNPKVVSVSRLPDGPRVTVPGAKENIGVMEATVTNLPDHKGAFAESMCGAAIFYTPDMTAKNPQWREVYSHLQAEQKLEGHDPSAGGSCDGGGWLQTSPDDKYLYHVVMGRRPVTGDPGGPGMLYALNIEKLLAAGSDTQCSIDTIAEDTNGGAEADCPTLADVLPVEDPTSGGPHWGALDNFAKNADGSYSETGDIKRLAYANYFLAKAGWGGDHKVCLVDIDENHKFSIDKTFKDEVTGEPCMNFNRASWPHGPFGSAKPHAMLFVVPDATIR
jgi:hypothetical protein